MLAARVGALLVAILVFGIVDAEAKGRGRGNGNAVKAQGNGPAFCRSGAGHPVHGWAWCEQKGWARADRRSVSPDRRVIVANPLPDGRVAIPRRTPRDRDDDRDQGSWWPF